MLYQDGISFVEDADQVDLYPYGTTEGFMAVQSVPVHGKEHDFQAFDLGYNPQQYLPPSEYNSPITDQNELAALPNGYSTEYDESYAYASASSDSYTHVGMPQTTTSHYSNLPQSTAAFNGQPDFYGNAPTSRKRKASVESFHSEGRVSKRIALQDSNGDYYDLKSEPSPYSSFVPTPTAISVPHIPYQLNASPHVRGHHHSTSNVSQVSVAVTAPYTPIVSPSFTTANTEHSPRAPATPSARPASVASNPKLVRTSTIPHHSPQPVVSSMTMPGHTQNFNPYTLYSPDSKARLHLEGNLDDVAQNWSAKELDERRKIVIFNREQKGNDIYATFEVVSQNEWKSHPRSVSCIWWAEKKEAYVTSVDTISLLESIVAARFTVEEKNRIRRNLEGFKPDTVSKAKPDTEEFFKIIMGFPNPKPRNIEKDVKVFPWKVLSVALQKIISKYSASYASTAASIQHQPKVYRPMEHHEYGYAASPAPEYHGGLQVASFPMYGSQGRFSAPVTPTSHLHLASQMGHGHEVHGNYGYSAGLMPQHNHAAYQGHPLNSGLMTQAQYWHHQGYSQEGLMPTAPVSAPPTGWPREYIDAIEYHRQPMTQYVQSPHH